MTSEPRQTGTEFSDQAIRSFLLGQLPEDQQTKFEERLFADAELEARVRLGEFELSDDYASARLTTAEHDLFRQRFLLASTRKEMLDVSRALHNRFGLSPSRTRQTIGQGLGNFFAFRQPAWQYACGAVVLILIFA